MFNSFQPDTPSQLVEDLNAVIEEETGMAPFSSYKNHKKGQGMSQKRSLDKEVGISIAY